MTDDSDAYTAHPVYRPFPSFVEWAEIGVDLAAFDRYVELLQRSREASRPEDHQAALDVATRYAAVDTGAIEGLYEVDRGFTRTVATQTGAWEAAIEARGSKVRLAIDDAFSGYEFVMRAAHDNETVSEVWLRELHEVICASQDTYTVYTAIGPQEHPLPKGVYKTMPNSPTLPDGRLHAYAPPLDTGPEMARLIAELRSEPFQLAHPVLQAAYAHYGFVCIHPFADGNGRVARALASVYLYRSPGVPLIVFADQRDEYFDSLERADLGDPRPLLDFVATRTIDSVGIVRSILARSAPPVGETMAAISRYFETGAVDEEILAAVSRLRALVLSELTKQTQSLPLPSQLQVRPHARLLRAPSALDGYSSVGEPGAIYISARSTWPNRVSVFQDIGIQIRQDQDAPSDLVLVAPAVPPLEAWVRELVPIEQESLAIRVSGWVEAVVAHFLQAIHEKLQSSR